MRMVYMNNRNHEILVYNVAEAANLLDLSKGSVYEAIHNGQLPSIRIGRRILIPRIALDKMLSEVQVNSVQKEV